MFIIVLLFRSYEWCSDACKEQYTILCNATLCSLTGKFLYFYQTVQCHILDAIFFISKIL